MSEDDLEGFRTDSKDYRKEEDATRWSEKVFEKYQVLKNTAQETLPKLWLGLEFASSVKTILNIRHHTLPFAGIILGPSSSLKTVVVELFRGCEHTFYTDKFSARSMVSHNSGLSEDKLKKIDMLPRIKNKFFLTPELSPIFSAREDDLLEVLGIMTRILDGHGYESDTGAQGHRGYNQEIMFTWLGAAVDIPYRVHKQLSVLGPKLYFLRLPKSEESDDVYYQQKDGADKTLGIRTALSDYIECFESNPYIAFEDGDPLPKIPLNHKNDDEQVYRYIIKLAKLLSRLRDIVPTWETSGSGGSEYAYTFANIEDPSRAVTQLATLARGHALSQGRENIKKEDIPIVIQTVLSTASMERVRIFELLIRHNGELTTTQINSSLDITNTTSLRTMTELKATGLVDRVDYTKESEQGYKTIEKKIVLKRDFDWFLTPEFKSFPDKPHLEKCSPRIDNGE